ncbi:GNAT family N-acetyltransferase [Mesorhizobium amorphae]|jgi:ribosomal protein S18 acetylase RimI-like enzyme|uniref:GNAT family N-acetyltransferase n=1 Tax=Mesorhizobium amorphae TaxID=71433 RepID=UPI0011820504|nr:GNAT family N-acetyltransferase [Mesorhizobium amorphae]
MTQTEAGSADDISIRLRRSLAGDLPAPVWADGFTMRAFRPTDAPAVHRLLTQTLQKEEKNFDLWWAQHSSDAEYDPALWFVVEDAEAHLVAVALCWTSDYLKYLAVHPSARRNGLAEALLLHVFAVFKARGASHVDLKTKVVENANAIRLYRRHGMVEVDWNG